MPATSTSGMGKEIKSWSGSYRAYIKEGNLVIQGNGKFSNYVAVFPVWEIKELLGVE